MRNAPLFRRLKTISRAVAVFALLTFGFQSMALPAHATIHATQNLFSTGDSAHLTNSDCDLCDLAAHQGVRFSPSHHFETIEPVILRSDIPQAETLLLHVAHLPPVRGPPSGV